MGWGFLNNQIIDIHYKYLITCIEEVTVRWLNCSNWIRAFGVVLR